MSGASRCVVRGGSFIALIDVFVDLLELVLSNGEIDDQSRGARGRRCAGFAT